MDVMSISGVRISGIVGCVPENLEENKISVAPLFGDKIDTVIKATGFTHRAIAHTETTSLDLCVYAAQELLQQTKTDPTEIGAIIQVTFTPEFLMPGDAQSAQARLGIPNNSMAFDMKMACSGYGYGLYIASMISKTLNKKVLLLDGDVQSKYVSKMDKSTVPVLADAGTATLLEPNKNMTDDWQFAFYSDGSKREVLYIPSGGAKNSITLDDITVKQYPDGSERMQKDIYMDGFEIFKFVSKEVSKFINDFMTQTLKNKSDYDAVVFHQANMYMIDQLAKKLGFSVDNVWKSGNKYGNPSSCSVPLTIAESAPNLGESAKPAKVMISGFGGGLSISVANINLDTNAYYSVIRKG